MNKRKSYNKRRQEKNKRFLLFVFLLLALSTAGFLYKSRAMDRELKEIEEEISSNKKKLEAINKEIEELNKDYEIRNTDDFKEKIAKEKLGMVKEEENENSDLNKEDTEDKENANNW